MTATAKPLIFQELPRLGQSLEQLQSLPAKRRIVERMGRRLIERKLSVGGIRSHYSAEKTLPRQNPAVGEAIRNAKKEFRALRSILETVEQTPVEKLESTDGELLIKLERFNDALLETIGRMEKEELAPANINRDSLALRAMGARGAAILFASTRREARESAMRLRAAATAINREIQKQRVLAASRLAHERYGEVFRKLAQ